MAYISTQIMVRDDNEKKTSPTYSGFSISDDAKLKDIALAFTQHKEIHEVGYRQNNMTVEQVAIIGFDIN